MQRKKGYNPNFDELYNNHFKLGLNLAKTFVDEHLAQDVLQDAFTKVYKNLHKQRFKAPINAQKWICKIIINTAIDTLKKNRYSREQMIGEERMNCISEFNTDILNSIILKETVNEAFQALETKGTVYKKAFFLKHVCGYKNKEISTILSISYSNTGAILSRGSVAAQEAAKLSNRV